MAKRVSADTITEITSAKGFATPAKSASTPPSKEDLIKEIRADLTVRAAEAQKALQNVDQTDERAVYDSNKRARRTAEDIKVFESTLAEVPKGFQLVPVLYSRIDPDAKQELTKEYSFNVRPRFLKFLADNHADELKKLGICDIGVERMKSGLDPANEQGELYSVNIDHIIERNGSGLWGAKRAADPDQPAAEAKFNPNHFGNFILLPEKIHEFKNRLNDLQHASETPLGSSKWILMMTPERNAAMSGFVCPPQDPSHRLAGLDLRIIDDFKKVEHGQFIVTTALAEMAEFKETGDVRTLVRGQILQADAKNTKVADLAADEAAAKPPGALRKAFSDAVAKNPDAANHLDTLVKPALKDVTQYVTRLFNTLQAKTNTPKERAAFWAFARFFRSQPMKDLRMDVEALPFAEASDLHSGFRQLARDVTKVCDKLDADAKAKYAKESLSGPPDFRHDPQQDNKPVTGRKQPPPAPVVQGKPLPRRPRKPRKGETPKTGEGRAKRTFGRPGHFGNGSR